MNASPPSHLLSDALTSGARRIDPLSDFPPGFQWGVATSAFQIEGAAQKDGKGPSIWDAFCEKPGVIADGSNGNVACNHYHRLEDDLNLIASLGVDLYRFSTAWSRVQPRGHGAWNEKGLAFYDRLIDGLLQRGIKPYLTLNHWDLPQVLQENGGWENRDTVYRFVDYAQGMARRFGDRVASITTHNEPWVISILGHETGVFAPGIKSLASALQVSHHLLLSHGLALQGMRAEGARMPMGIVLNLSPIHAATNSQADLDKARLDDGKLVRWYMDPLFKCHYPADMLEAFGAAAPQTQAGDMANIATPMDFWGINYYTRSIASADDSWRVAQGGRRLTDMGWEIYPEGLTELLLRLHQDYTLPATYISENGAAFDDQPVDDQVHDIDRIDYLASHITAVHEAIQQGVPMAGYMVWSLMDNFEWASGYEKRFGIVHIDYETQKRTPKDSALWYRDFLMRQKALRQIQNKAPLSAEVRG